MSTTIEEIEKTKTSKDKKDELLLDSLEIKGYRCFEHLTIEKLGRVNLIVGKNNVGKTALLEALWIYANSGYSHLMFEILRERDEIPSLQNGNLLVQPQSSKGLRNLFFKRPNLEFIPYDYPEWIDNELRIQIGKITDISGDEPKFVDRVLQITGIRPNSDSNDDVPQTRTIPTFGRKINNFYVKATGIKNEKLIEFWDIVTLTPLEDKVINALHLLLPKLNRIDFIGYPNGSENRVPVVRVSDEKERVPLKSFGEGMTRLLGLSLALVQCEDGMLFIDEIESGLHYSTLLGVWRLIFNTARELNVQVFVTTHSSDCVKAFQRAAEEDKEDEGMLIRLARKGDKIKAILFDEKELETVVENDIEVR